MIDLSNLRLEIEKYNDEIFEKEEIRKQNKELSFQIVEGSIPIIVSAPHCVIQTREGKMKSKEGETGAIVQLLAKRTKCYAIYKTYHNNDDANYDITNNPYKEELKNIIITKNIKLLIDIHGARNENDFDIDIGTDNGINVQNNAELINVLKNCLKSHGIENIKENEKFKASSPHTISKYISETTNIPCIQLEVAGRYRYIENIEGIEKLLNALSEFIGMIMLEGKD